MIRKPFCNFKMPLVKITEDTPATPGYYYSTSKDELASFLEKVLDNTPIGQLSVSFHVAGSFLKDDERKIIHTTPDVFNIHSDGIIPIDVQIDNFIEDYLDPEKSSFSKYSGSGFSLQVILSYWVNIVPYSPNNIAVPTSRNTQDYRDGTPAPIELNLSSSIRRNFIGVIAQHFTEPGYTKSGKVKSTYPLEVIEEFIKQRGFERYAELAVNVSTIPAIHAELNEFNIIIWSITGIPIYAKILGEVDEVPIHMLKKGDNLHLIRSIRAFLNENKTNQNRVFCTLCKKFHIPNACNITGEVICINDIKDNEKDKGLISPISKPKIIYPNTKHCLVAYADFEAIIDNNIHKPASYSLIPIIAGDPPAENFIFTKSVLNLEDEVFNEDGEIIKFDNIIEMFLTDLYSIIKKFQTNDYGKEANLIDEAGERFKCLACNKNKKGKYYYARHYGLGIFGYYCRSCFLAHNNTFIVYFHNFKGYDHHILLEQLLNKDSKHNTCRGKSINKMDVITHKDILSDFIRITFKDTFNFLPESLASLANKLTTLKYTPDKFKEAFNSGKGEFPYEWFDDFNKLEEIEVPQDPADWDSRLTNKKGTEEIIKKANQIWIDNNMQIFHDYVLLYNELDVWLLLEVFEAFRDTTVNEDKIDPVYFDGAPGLTFYLARMYENSLDMHVIPDKNVYLDVSRNIRGGVTQVVTKYANIEDVDETIVYLDVNTMYSYCMKQKLANKYLGTLDALPDNYDSDDNFCYFIKGDFSYPEYLHDLPAHLSMPLMPHQYNNKLCTTFLDKKDMLIHSKVFKYYLSKGLVCDKIHYVYKFKQEYIIKDYVETNIQKRNSSTDPGTKDYYKLKNNALFGKTCENVFKYKIFSVTNVNSGDRENKCMSKAKSHITLGNCILYEECVTRYLLDKPIQIGFTILELAKLMIYEFIYELFDVIPEGSTATMLYTDTDSVIFKFKGFNGVHPYKYLLTTSLASKLDIPINKDGSFGSATKTPGLWSDDTKYKTITEFIGLRAKQYAYSIANDRDILKHKGIPKNALKDDNNPMNVNDFRNVLFEMKDLTVNIAQIRATKNVLTSTVSKKLALSTKDNKRITYTDKVTTLPFGYKGELYSNYMDDVVIE